MIKVIFAMEQHIGHRTYYENIRSYVDADPDIRATWVEVTYHREGSLWARLPGLPAGLRGTLMGRQQVRRALSRPDWDVAVFNTQVPAALAGRLVNRRPYILATDITPLQYDRMGDHYGHRPDRSGLLRRYKHGVNTRLFQGAAHLLPWSTWTAASLQNDYGVDPGQIEVLPPGVDTDQWQPGDLPANQTPRILFVGGDFYRKGGELLLQAFQQLPAGTAELVLVTRSALEPMPGVTAHQDMTPNSPELIALYQSCDIFVLPTAAEAFGIAAVEASAIGLPVIASRVGGLADVVVDGETGFLIRPGDVAVLTVRLGLLLENSFLRGQMGKAARGRVERYFNARENAGRLIEIVKASVKAENRPAESGIRA